MANGSAHFKKGIVIQILNATDNYPVLPAQRFYPALRETSAFGCARRPGDCADLGFKGVQIPTWDERLIDLVQAADSRAY